MKAVKHKFKTPFIVPPSKSIKNETGNEEIINGIIDILNGVISIASSIQKTK